MIERARVQPHARGPECPGIAYRAREEMLAEALADCAREEPEVGDLDGAVLRHPAQLVPARERAAAPRDVQGDLGLPEVGADLLVGPVPAVAPVVGLADPAVALAIQCGRRPLDRLDGEAGKDIEGRPELTRTLQVEVRARRLHITLLQLGVVPSWRLSFPHDLQQDGHRSPPARAAPRELHGTRTVLLL